MNDHFTTHLLWAVLSGDLISNESIFCHESHHSYLMCNKEQTKEELNFVFLSEIVLSLCLFKTLDVDWVIAYICLLHQFAAGHCYDY